MIDNIIKQIEEPLNRKTEREESEHREYINQTSFFAMSVESCQYAIKKIKEKELKSPVYLCRASAPKYAKDQEQSKSMIEHYQKAKVNKKLPTYKSLTNESTLK